MSHVIAIDGGGTKCLLGLFDDKGSLIQEVRTGPANIVSNLDLAISNINQGIDALIMANGKPLDKRNISIVAGLAGAFVPNAQDRVLQALSGYQSLKVTSDLEISCYSANEGSDCALIILGTGSSLAQFKDKQPKQFGGDGFILGDYASGAYLGRELLREYLLFLDQIRPFSPVFEALDETLGKRKHTLVERYASANPSAFAEYAYLVFDYIDNCDLCADIIEESLQYLMSIIDRHFVDLPVFIDGGLASKWLPIMQSLHPCHLVKRSALHGAFLYHQFHRP